MRVVDRIQFWQTNVRDGELCAGMRFGILSGAVKLVLIIGLNLVNLRPSGRVADQRHLGNCFSVNISQV